MVFRISIALVAVLVLLAGAHALRIACLASQCGRQRSGCIQGVNRSGNDGLHVGLRVELRLIIGLAQCGRHGREVGRRVTDV